MTRTTDVHGQVGLTTRDLHIIAIAMEIAYEDYDQSEAWEGMPTMDEIVACSNRISQGQKEAETW